MANVTIESAGISTPQESGGVHTLTSGQNATFNVYITNTRSYQSAITVQYVVGGQQVGEYPVYVPANSSYYKSTAVFSWNKLQQYVTGIQSAQVRLPSYSPYGQQVTSAGSIDIKPSGTTTPPGGNIQVYTMDLSKTNVSPGNSVKFTLEVDNLSSNQKGVVADFYYNGIKVDNAVGYVPANTNHYPVSYVIPYSDLSPYGTGTHGTYAILESGGSWPQQKIQGPNLTLVTAQLKPTFTFDLTPKTSAVDVKINPTNPNSYAVDVDYKIEAATVNSSGQALNGTTLATPSYRLSPGVNSSITKTYNVNGIPAGTTKKIQICVYQTGFSRA